MKSIKKLTTLIAAAAMMSSLIIGANAMTPAPAPQPEPPCPIQEQSSSVTWCPGCAPIDEPSDTNTSDGPSVGQATCVPGDNDWDQPSCSDSVVPITGEPPLESVPATPHEPIGGACSLPTTSSDGGNPATTPGNEPPVSTAIDTDIMMMPLYDRVIEVARIYWPDVLRALREQFVIPIPVNGLSWFDMG